MKRSILVAAVLAASLVQASGSALVVPPPPPWPTYCDINGMTRTARELIGNEFVYRTKIPGGGIAYGPSTMVRDEGPAVMECSTMPICKAREEAQEAISAAHAAVKRVDIYQRLQAYVRVCEAAGYGS